MEGRARFVAAPVTVVATVVVTLALAAAGAWVLLRPDLGLGLFIVAVVLFWASVMVLVIGIGSALAWRGRRTVVGGESAVGVRAVDAVRSRAGWRHLVLSGEGGTRVLHGFVALRERGAERLAGRLAGLVGTAQVAAVIAPREPEPVVPPTPESGAQEVPEEAQVPVDVPPAPDATVTLMRPRRALDWDAEPGEAVLDEPLSDETVIIRPHHAALDPYDAASDDDADEELPELATIVLPRRAIR